MTFNRIVNLPIVLSTTDPKSCCIKNGQSTKNNPGDNRKSKIEKIVPHFPKNCIKHMPLSALTLECFDFSRLESAALPEV